MMPMISTAVTNVHPLALLLVVAALTSFFKEASKMLADQAKDMGIKKCKRAEALEASAKE